MNHNSRISKFVFLLFLIFSLSPINVLHATNIDSLQKVLKGQIGIDKANTLNYLSECLLAKNPKLSLEYARQAYNITEGIDYENEITAISNLVESFLRVDKYDSSDMFVEKGLILSRGKQDTLRMMHFLTDIGWTYYYHGDYNKSHESFNEAMVLFNSFIEKHPKHPGIHVLNYAKLLNNKATIFTRQGYYDSAIVYFKESLEYRQKHNAGAKYLAPTYINIGSVCYKNENYDLALKYFKDALILSIEIKDSVKIASCYNNLGLVYKELNDTICALGNYKNSLKIKTEIKDIRGQILVLNSIGTLYLSLNELNKAKQNLTKAIELNRNGKYQSALAISLHNLANYYLKIKQPSKAINNALKGLEIMKQIGKRGALEGVYKLLSEAYEMQDNYHTSLQYYKLFKSIHDSIFNANSRENYNKLQLQLETTQKEKKIELLKKEQEKQKLKHQILKNKQTAILIIALIIIVLAVVITFGLYNRRQKDRQIHKQKELVHKKEKKLAEVELERIKLKEEELQQSILYKSKQLSTHALHMVQKNTMLLEIQDELKNLAKKSDTDDKSQYKRIYQQIKLSLRADNDWDVFKLYFEDINKNFYTNLKKVNPNLTTYELRLCALIKMNMNSMEMASVLNIAHNSIKSARYRLKKKLKLDIDANLEEFIRKID